MMDSQEVNTAIREIKFAWRFDTMYRAEERHWDTVCRGFELDEVRAVLKDLLAKGRSTRPSPGDFSGLCWQKRNAQAGPPEPMPDPEWRAEPEKFTPPVAVKDRIAEIKAKAGIR